MVAYSFQKRFIEPIIAGTKCQTIRANGKRRHARPGDAIQLYFGMRTKHCRKIIPDVVCCHVMPIKIYIGPRYINQIFIFGLPMTTNLFDGFAVKDGFENAADMHEFWLRNHDAGMFNGQIIGWNDGTKEALAA